MLAYRFPYKVKNERPQIVASHEGKAQVQTYDEGKEGLQTNLLNASVS